MPTLYLIRGLPGSGKTTLAKQLTSVHFEADQQFETPDGYVFDQSKLTAAHAQCQVNVLRAMAMHAEVIAVSNTFTRQWELLSYRDLAEDYGYTVVEITMSGKLFPNVHSVPEDVIKAMRDRWEP